MDMKHTDFCALRDLPSPHLDAEPNSDRKLLFAQQQISR